MQKETLHITASWQVADYINEAAERSLAVWPDTIKDYQRGEPICLVSPKEKETETDVANAILIAAAPDMLEALQNYTKAVERLLELYPELTIDLIAAAVVHDAHQDALTAIKKATVANL